VALALEPMIHHAIRRLPRSAVVPMACVYLVPVCSVFAQVWNVLSANRLRVYIYPLQAG
jgi:hypothetical protein